MGETYAVLGATGNTGQSLLRILNQYSDKKIHAFVRSRSKLEKQSPELVKSSQLQVFEGGLSDHETLSQCIKGTKAVFLALAASENIPYCRIAQDSASVVVAVLEKIRTAAPGTTLPRLVILSSASLDRHLSRNIPRLAQTLLHNGAYWIYSDLERAEQFLRSHSEWVDCTFVKPGGLVHDEQKGHELSLDRQQTFLGFLDMAAGMVEIADTEGDAWRGKNVSVLPTSPNVKIEWWVPWFLVKGLICTFFPGLYFLFHRS